MTATQKTILSVERVEDLAEGEIAKRDDYYRFDLRQINGEPIGVDVIHLVRRGDTLYAATAHDYYPVSGYDPEPWILCPTHTPKKR